MLKAVGFAVLALALAAGFAGGAGAQTEKQLAAPLAWTSADGGLHFAVPAGWSRSDPLPAKGPALAVSKGDQAPGDPGVHCTVAVQLAGQAQPGLTQAAYNARILAGAGSITVIDEKRVATVGGIVTIDGFLSDPPHILIVMKAAYIHGGNIYAVDAKCGRTHPPGILGADDLKTARILFNAISVTP